MAEWTRQMTDRPTACSECETELDWEGDVAFCDCGVVYVVLTNVVTGDVQLVKARLGKAGCFALREDLEEAMH
jgi:hypothetical protein